MEVLSVKAFTRLFPSADGQRYAVQELRHLAFPLMAREEGGGDFSALPLEERLARIEAALLSMPLWAVETIESLLRELDEEDLAMCFSGIASQIRVRSPQENPWQETFAAADNRKIQRALPSHDDCSPLEIDQVASHLMPGGSFSQLLPGYESRPGQVDMCKAVTHAFNEGKHLMIEAGTGVGKSLAYLIPAAAWARLNDVPVIISTNTRNLQTQLIEKDLPRVFEAFQKATGESTPFRAVVIKGRSNYFCLRRLAALLSNRMFELDRHELRNFAEAIAWLVRTPDGDLDTFAGSTNCDSTFLSKIASSGEECPGRRCRYFRRCFLQKARSAAAAAHLVIANHALVFAEARNSGSILPAYSQIVFDEAHNLEDAATRHLSVELSPSRVNMVLRRISRGRGESAGGVLEQVARQLYKGGIAADGAQLDELTDLVKKIRRGLERIRASSRRFFEQAYDLIPEASDSIRFRCVNSAPEDRDVTDIIDMMESGKPVPVRMVCRNRVFVCPGPDWDEAAAVALKEKFRDALSIVIGLMQQLVDGLNRAATDELGLYNDLPLGVEGQIGVLSELAADLDFVWAGTDGEYVFWVEKAIRSSRLAQLIAAPLSIAETLNGMLYQEKSSVVFCSATLRVGSSFNYMMKRLGVNLQESQRVMACVADSPFNYLAQCRAIAPTFLPEPGSTSEENTGYVEQLSAMMLDVFLKTRGRAMGLFTSYQMMNQVAKLLSVPLHDAGIKLLVHGADGTRDQITRIFRSGVPAVLLGTHSFWEGVDVVGEALSCVVMARLPFSAVGDPVVEARSEQIDQNGGSSFREYALPLAVIRFRQGFGRLIRSRTDRGAVVVADPRIMTKNYGAVFRKSLPCPVRQADGRDRLLQMLDELFDPQNMEF